MTTPPSAFDLDAYLARIGYCGPCAPTVAVLAGIQRLHVCTIPFENIDVLLGRPIPIDLPSVERKLVHDRRGGYCFEQNTLLLGVLRAIGFCVTPMLARVRRNAPPEVRTPLTHMVLIVDVDGRQWLADVGFGAVGATAPLALDRSDAQETPLEPHRLLHRGRTILHQAKLGEEWADVYEFVAEEPPPIDFELGNWFSCTHPKAHFISNLVVSRVEGARRLNIFNREFTVRWADGRAEKRDITSPEDLIELLAEKFGLSLLVGTRIDIPAAPWEG